MSPVEALMKHLGSWSGEPPSVFFFLLLFLALAIKYFSLSIPTKLQNQFARLKRVKLSYHSCSMLYALSLCCPLQGEL